jgi:hypothetical protein
MPDNQEQPKQEYPIITFYFENTNRNFEAAKYEGWGHEIWDGFFVLSNPKNLEWHLYPQSQIRSIKVKQEPDQED